MTDRASQFRYCDAMTVKKSIGAARGTDVLGARASAVSQRAIAEGCGSKRADSQANELFFFFSFFYGLRLFKYGFELNFFDSLVFFATRWP